MTDRYAVFGNPIEHSKSPLIHQCFAKQTGQSLQYAKELVGTENFQTTAGEFFAGGGKGLNITVPFKLDAYDFASRLTKRAKQAGAVNTLAMQDDGKILGENTDGIGLVRDMKVNRQWILEKANILILGAGGAVRGILAPLLAENPSRLMIANRTVEKAKQLANNFDDYDEISGCGFDDLKDLQFDIVINGTAASLAGDLPPLPENLLSDKAVCYDMMYSAEPTVFMTWAKKNGASDVADGLGMLVEQAAESFLLWRGIRPETQQVIEAIRNQLMT